MKSKKRTASGIIHHGAKGWAIIDRHGHVLAYNHEQCREEMVDICLVIGRLNTPYVIEVYGSRKAATIQARQINAPLAPGMRCCAVHAVKISTTITFWED